MTYSDVYEVLAMYLNDTLELFADGWSRFPSYPVAGILIDRINASLETWSRLNKHVADKLILARNEIEKRAN